MSGTHPRFFWYELQTRDLDAAQAFYGAVVGWGMSDAAQPGMRYTILSAGSRGVGQDVGDQCETLIGAMRGGW